MAKLLENTYRHINIALVNEMCKFSHELNIDFWNVIECASTKPFGFQPFFPGPGVGGHCIPIDPNYLSHRVRTELGYPFRFVELAQEVNESMPRYVASRTADILNDERKSIRGSSITLLGVTYKPGIADQRESPAIPLAEYLLSRGATLSYADPFVDNWRVGERSIRRITALSDELPGVDMAIHLQHHRDFSSDLLTGAGIPVLDTRGTLSGPRITAL